MIAFAGMTPEQRARVKIDQQLSDAGWAVHDRQEINLYAAQGVAVRETTMATGAGRADYLLYVDQVIVGVIEAKPAGTTLSEVHWQSRRYAFGLTNDQQLNALMVGGEVPFIFEASGVETYFTNLYDPEPRARRVFNVPRAEAIARIIREVASDNGRTWRGKVHDLPTLESYDLRPAQFRSIKALERSLREQQFDRSLVQMATGAGKTRMAVTECYRLLKFGGFNRILFLVDRNNLGDQTVREFADYTTPDDGRKFTQLYAVDKLSSAGLVDSSKVVVSTIQRVWSVLKGEAIPDVDDPHQDSFQPTAPVEVTQYNPEMPPEAFDLIIVDECHRSIYGLWRGVLDYFDAHVVGLTATPTKQALGYFHQNLVAEYTFAESVADNVNVDFDVFRIQTSITAHGSVIEAGSVVPAFDRRTRVQRAQMLEDDVPYAANELDRSVVVLHVS